MDDKTVCTAHKYLSREPNDGGKTQVPTLRVKQENGHVRTVETNTDKSRVLQDTFLEPEGDGAWQEEEDYTIPKFKYEPITDDQILQEISCRGPYKAAGANGITNVVFIQCIDLLIPHPCLICWEMFMLKMYPKQCKDLCTMVLRKLAKPDYTLPSAHWLIVLLKTKAKILLLCVAKDLAHRAEVHRLMSDNHFRCRPGRTTMDSLHYIVK